MSIIENRVRNGVTMIKVEVTRANGITFRLGKRDDAVVLRNVSNNHFFLSIPEILVKLTHRAFSNGIRHRLKIEILSGLNSERNVRLSFRSEYSRQFLCIAAQVQIRLFIS